MRNAFNQRLTAVVALGLFAGLSAGACGPGGDPRSELFAEAREYRYRLIEDDFACEHSWELASMNCYQTALFCPAGDAEIVVTDILNTGSYSIDGDAIEVVFEHAGDLPPEVRFGIRSDDEITDSQGKIWRLQREDPEPYLAPEARCTRGF